MRLEEEKPKSVSLGDWNGNMMARVEIAIVACRKHLRLAAIEKESCYQPASTDGWMDGWRLSCTPLSHKMSVSGSN